MNKKSKRLLTIGGFVAAVFILSSCTASFCAPADKAHMLYNLDSGLVENDQQELVYNDNLNAIITKARDTNGYAVPSMDFFVRLDEEVLELANTYYTQYINALPTDAAEKVAYPTLTPEQINEKSLEKYGHLKFVGQYDEDTHLALAPNNGNDLWANMDYWVYELGQELGIENVPNSDFYTFYKAELNTKIARNRACIAITDGQYGPDGQKIPVTAKTWAESFAGGAHLIEGLLVYPIAAFIEVLTAAFGAGGWGQVWAIVIVTVAVRSIMLLVTLKSTISQQKMQALQPELAKLQQKYPNSNTNNAEKQALANAQMALYKKNNVNPLSTILVMFVQFPIFIAVWGAMTGSASLASDAVLGLNLNAELGSSIMANFFTSGWWTAVALFLLMAASQFVSTRISQWLSKGRVKKEVQKTTANPAADKQQSQMKMVTWFMFIMIIVMSWTLPAAMGIYWLIGALISIAQAIITDYILKSKRSKK
jgi:YidC/Oxa1 family membrane protein insertase